VVVSVVGPFPDPGGLAKDGDPQLAARYDPTNIRSVREGCPIMKRAQQVEIGKWIDQIWEKGAAGSAQRQFRMALNTYAQEGESRDSAEAQALTSVRQRQPGFRPTRRVPSIPVGVNTVRSRWRRS
jgi:hypothetical protein